LLKSAGGSRRSALPTWHACIEISTQECVSHALARTYNSSVVALVIVQDVEMEAHDLQQRCDIVASVLELWRRKVPTPYVHGRVCMRLCVWTCVRACVRVSCILVWVRRKALLYL
jgi:hypothetical protein